MFVMLALAWLLAASPLQIQNADYDRQTYISIPLKLEPLRPALNAAETMNGARLKTRGEAHLTIVTPPEMEQLSDLNKKSLLASLARTLIRLKPVCLGVGQAGELKTYFVVVDAPELSRLRRKNGLNAVFDPHVTLGFTERDLFVNDGVRKDRRACRGKI